ncbi:MAG TPA: PspC domain-containing protein [Bacteroidetes bacterium]|nr:PspC domain-containing protein [Bacteroidota bacterium]
MNKISNINLGGFPFTIDEDAYEALDRYLKAIHHHFRHSEGYEEITTDIETRMAELFQEKLEGRPIITLPDVKNVIGIMGTPEDFGAADPFEEETKSTAGKGPGKFRIKTGKRLFRDPEHQAIAGVCSGIAAYFGIRDPLWVRLAFIFFVFTGGFAIVVYLVLWAVVPKAETASDRLAMRGEPANVENISKIIEEELEHVSKKVSELGEELKSEFTSKKKRSPGRMTVKKEADTTPLQLLSERPLPKGFMF